MAGAGFRTFVDGDVLTASQVNTFLMEQAVMVFADASARTTALPTPSEGMVTYLADTDQLEKYTGAAWMNITADSIAKALIDAKGDLIVGTADNTPARLAVGTNGHRLVAASGETAGVQWVADTANTVVDAKGDLLAGTAADTLARLAVGTNGQVLVADSSTSTGLAWAGVPAGGKILQVVTTTNTTSTAITSASFTDSSLSLAITPSSTSSKILVLVNQPFRCDRTQASQLVFHQLVRTSTAIDNTRHFESQTYYEDVSTFMYLDSPNTTSAVTYKTQGRVNNASDAATLTYQQSSTPSNMTLLEVGP